MHEIIFVVDDQQFLVHGSSILRGDFIISIMFSEIESGEVEPITSLESKFYNMINSELQNNLELYRKVLNRYKKLIAFI